MKSLKQYIIDYTFQPPTPERKKRDRIYGVIAYFFGILIAITYVYILFKYDPYPYPISWRK